jgi:diguanylate cyclase (GGDEF)-like protein
VAYPELIRRAMPRFEKPSIPFLLSVAVPAAAILAIAATTLLGSLGEIASEVNRTESTVTRRTAEAAIEAALRRLANTHHDYAVWDDAARKLYGTPDPQFVAENFAASTHNPVFFDTAYLLDADGATVVAYRNGAPTRTPAGEAFGPSLDRVLAGLPWDGVNYSAHTAFVDGAWGPAILAAGPIVPLSSDFSGARHPVRYLIISKAFDASTIDQIAKDYLIDGLTLSAETGGANGLALKDPDGGLVANLVWSAPRPGSVALARLKPQVIGALGLLAATMLMLVVVAGRGYARMRRGEAEARHAALTDSLSGLPNRSALIEHLRRLFDRLGRGGSQVAVLYLDLDGFKEVNDTFGHDIGDHLLRKVATGFGMITGKHLLVRLGGDEFAVVIEDGRAGEIAGGLGESLVRFFSKPFDVEGRVIAVSVSVGIALVESPEVSVEEALRRADVAMYQAKQQGRNRVCVFDDSLDSLRLKRIAIAADLRRALLDRQLIMFYQPVYDAGTGAISSVEALVRWPRMDDGQPISPAEFIPIAEETGVIDDLGAWTLRRACQDARAWPGIKVSVNVSPAQLQNPGFAEGVRAVLNEMNFPASRLEFEVTETYFIAHPDQASRALSAIRQLGVATVLDDFGTGYSSIGYLRTFSFDKLKLDRSLIAGINRDENAQRLVHATVALADALDLSVTAEGVETEEEAIVLRAAGCTAFQGFFFGRPAPAGEITALLGVDARFVDAPVRRIA